MDCQRGRPRADCGKFSSRRKKALAEVFEVEPPAHALATQRRIGVVIAETPGLDQRDDRLDEIAAAAALALAGENPGLRAPKPAVIVDPEKQCGIDRRRLDRLTQNRRGAGLCEKLQTARRLNPDKADNRRRGQRKVAMKQRRRVERLICVEKDNVVFRVERGAVHFLDLAERDSEPRQRAFQRLGVEVRAGPKQAATASEILDESLRRHETTRSVGRTTIAPKRDELRMR